MKFSPCCNAPTIKVGEKHTCTNCGEYVVFTDTNPKNKNIEDNKKKGEKKDEQVNY